ncbi:hypothetical protein J437_LFUL003540 [Ladona fulva]|uniref:Mitochondrial thiamine pyrophosphate carrier n=1 Tax=Ladona fulva TaxID=123851 RepID=A0A8K0JUG7_LADFU|nr:hypothetical protein J437_LFUL003540 [Ladona fulva]
MIGYDPASTKNATKTQHTVAGAVSGVFTRAVCQPLDVIKIRFQLQWEPLSRNAPNRGLYTGVVQATGKILKDEGVKALWKGHVPAQYLSVVYGSTQLLTRMWHDFVVPVIPVTWANEYSPVTHFTCGSMAGAVATLTSFPFDVIRTRLVAQGEPKLYSGMFHAATSMYAKEGVGSFFRGLTPAVIQTAPLIGLQFGFYNFFIDLWNKSSWVSSQKEKSQLTIAAGTLGSGALAGLGSKTLVYPLDLIKKRLQVRGFEEAREQFGKVVVYKGVWQCLHTTVQEEGFLGLFKGYTPSVLKASLVSALHFAFYEWALYAQVTMS